MTIRSPWSTSTSRVRCRGRSRWSRLWKCHWTTGFLHSIWKVVLEFLQHVCGHLVWNGLDSWRLNRWSFSVFFCENEQQIFNLWRSQTVKPLSVACKRICSILLSFEWHFNSKELVMFTSLSRGLSRASNLTHHQTRGFAKVVCALYPGGMLSSLPFVWFNACVVTISRFRDFPPSESSNLHYALYAHVS